MNFLNYFVTSFIISALMLSSTLCSAEEAHTYFERKGLIVSGKQSDSSLTITIVGDDVGLSHIFQIIDPKRIVIDIPLDGSNDAKNIPILSSDEISAIRIGGHKDHLRVVLDVKDENVIMSESTSSQKLLITLSQSKSNKSIIALSTISPPATPTTPPIKEVKLTPIPPTTSSPTPSPEQSQFPTVIPEAILTDTPTHIPTGTPSLSPTKLLSTSTPTLTPTPISTSLPTSTAVATLNPTLLPTPNPPLAITPTGKTLDAISFEKIAGESIAKLELSERSQFKLTKEKDRLYKIEIPNCTLKSSGLSLPQFPQDDVVGFTLVQAQQVGDSLEIKIGLDDGMRATAVNKDNAVVIKVAPAGF